VAHSSCSSSRSCPRSSAKRTSTAQSYALTYARTPEQRELDYVRQTGASVETAKEVDDLRAPTRS
jgi:hypothetical protein